MFYSQAQLEVHLCNGWCKEMHWLNTPALEDRRKLYKVLTGKDSDPAIFQDTPQKAVAPVQQPQKQQEKKLQFFNVHDKRIYDKFNNKKQTNETVKKEHTTDSVIENCPWTGSIFHRYGFTLNVNNNNFFSNIFKAKKLLQNMIFSRKNWFIFRK